MSHMARKIFRPGKGNTHARFTTAFMNGATTYPGDLVCWDITAPATQGDSGVIDGKTLGTTDFVSVILPPAASAAADGLQAGIVIGPTVTRPVPTATTADLIGDNALTVIQTWGVCADVYAVTSTDSAAGILCSMGATTGAVTQQLTTTAEGTTVADNYEMVGFVLTAEATDHTRATVATEPGLDMFVRCDF